MAPEAEEATSHRFCVTAGIKGVITRSQRVRPVFDKYATDEGTLPVANLEDVLCEVACSMDHALISTVTEASDVITYEELLALVGMLQAGKQANSEGCGSSEGGAAAFASKAPLKKVLTKNRCYMETGNLSYDDAVLSYISKLDDHRRKCEAEGRYPEAKAAAKRLADLKTAQVERLRQELTSNQHKELGEVSAVYEEETRKFHNLWDRRVKDYETALVMAVDELKASHSGAIVCFGAEAERKRPQAPRHSKDYLIQRSIQDKLAKSKLYVRAGRVKELADELYDAEMCQTVASWEAETKLKLAMLQGRQQREFEALLQRGARGRDELERKRVTDTSRRSLRLSNIVAELENLHKLEIVHLENFLDGQVQAGKAMPLKDGYRRKREQLLSTAF
ncbi:MAG: hypothetical protein WDW36_002946 [Sanguina aurantia]